MSDQSEFIQDETLPVVVHFSPSEDTECTLKLESDGVYYWQIPDFMTDSLFADFLTDIVDAISDQDTKKFLQLLHPSPEELRRLNQKRIKWFRVSDEETHRRVRENVKSFRDIVPSPSLGNITSVDVRINDETDPSGELRSEINQLIASTKNECYAESDGAEETDECLDSFVDNEYSPDEEEEIDKEVQANPEKPCYYPAQIEMAAILKKRIDTIMSYYHNIPSLSDVFNDVEFVVYTARYRMLSDQTEKRICHPDAGVLSKEELESWDDCSGKKRMFMYVRSQETETRFEELKTNVQEKPKTLFVIIADECHWGITKDKEEKPSAHNLFINEWCKYNSPKNAVVVQISATPFNLLTQNSRLPLVKCVLLNDKVSTTLNDYEAGDLVVLEREPNLEEHVKSNSKEVELHVVHWSEVELKNFETGIRMKLKSALPIEDAPYQYLHVSSDWKLGVTSSEHNATDFIVQGSHGIVTLKVLATNEQQRAKPLTIRTDAQGNLEAKVASHDQQPTKFEVKFDFGVGVVAFGSCENQDHYIAVDEHGYVSLKAAKVERKCGVSIMKPPPDVARVSNISYQFYIDRCGPAEVDKVGRQYMNLNFYLSTLNCSNKNDQKIREDKSFQKIVDKAKRQKKMTTDLSSFPIDALLCAEYCYHILNVSVYDSNEKIRQALTSPADESPAAEFDRRLNSFVRELELRKTTTIPTKRCIDPEAFELVRRELCDMGTRDFNENLKRLGKLQKHKSSKEKHEEVEEELSTSFLTCLMHLPQQELLKIKEDARLISVKEKLKVNGCQAMVQKWKNIVQTHETSSLVENLIQSGKGKLGKMKIVRAKSMKTADQFYYTLRLARAVSSLDECFEVIRDYGGIQIENQLMNTSSPFFRKLQAVNCTYKFDCRCIDLKLQTGRKKCANCQHVHKLITQYEDLENLACVLILVDKGRMGDTFPQSFDCLDLRLNYDSSREFKEGSSLYLSTLIQELGRLCRYANASANESPYVLVGRVLFKKLKESLQISPSMSAISCTKADRYMTKSSRSKGTTSSSLRWQGYEAHKDSYDHLNEQTHCNRILLQAEPQIGKTGTYLCLIKDLRLDIIGKEKVSLSSTNAFDEGTFYQHKECDLSEELPVVNENEGWQDWEFPYWKTIENSPSLYEKPVASGKYSIGGCFYTHDMEESPYILMNPEQNEPTKSGHQYHKMRDCADGIRAWHWYHFENCAECGRLLQGKESVLETVDINIDGGPVPVKCSLPSSRPSFHHVLEYLKSTGSKDWAAALGSAPTLPYWIFHPSHRDDPRKCILNYNHVMQQSGDVANYVQVVVVRSGQFEAYRSTWGKVLVIIQLPDTLPNCELGPSEGGVGYTRLFIQKMAFSLNLEYVFMIDDNVAVMYEAVFNTGDPNATEQRVLRDENDVMKMQRCSFLKPLTHLQKIAQGKDIPPIDERKYEPHPLKDSFESQEFPLYNYTGPAKLFGDKQHNSYGVLGLLRSVPKAVNPYSKTQVYAAILLNVKSTVEKGVFYRPWPCWEDLRFNDDCDKAGLWVVKCNRYSFLKVQYKDWINNLALPKIFEWKVDSILEERPFVSELPKGFEERIILEHLLNFVNSHGPEKCFKGSIGYDRKDSENDDTISPTRIVDQLKQVETRDCTEEGSANEVPVVILSFCAANETLKNLVLLVKTFGSTKEKIVFVTSAKEAIKRWPQMTLGTMSTRSGICISSEMSDRNAQFAIFSAADPKRHSLRYILIEASFPQDDEDEQEGMDTISEEATIENNPSYTRNEPNVEESTSSERLQHTSNVKKSVKRSLQESENDSAQSKRRKMKEDYRLQEDLILVTSAEEVRNCPIHDEEMASSNMLVENNNIVLFTGAAEDGSVENGDDSNFSTVSDDQETPVRKGGARNVTSKITPNIPAYMEGANLVTGIIVDLWREYKEIQGSKMQIQQKGSSDLTTEEIHNKLDDFTTDRLQKPDGKGYTALLKACCLPSMSPHVMQYLITERKVDLNCQVPSDFDRNCHPIAKGLIPGMSALSVAIRKGNVKSVPTFMTRPGVIKIRSVDQEGNTALHHCVLSNSKSSFQNLFKLFKPLEWKEMRNNDLKNPLDICLAMEKELRGRSKGKEKSLNFLTYMREEMERVTA